MSATAGRLRREIAALSPGYGAWVMATGIVSTGLALVREAALSDALFVIACLAFALLLVAYVWRAVGYRQRALADARDPSRAFGYFSMVAAANVIAVRLALARDPTAALVLGAASVPVWLVLTYGILGAMVIGRRAGSMLPGVNGSWFLLVVATQSLSVTSSIVGASHPALTRAMAALAVALWAIGVVLYLMLAVVVTLHLLELDHAPHALSPTYWIYMGATAISVLAAARILQFPASLPVIAATRDVVSGLGFLLWAFGSWWMPLLLGFAIGRHVILHEHLRYEPAWWSMVFPLGMYAAASTAYGRTGHMGFMVDIARGEVWLGFAAWLGVAGAMIGSLLRPPPDPSS
ncbi:MAG TPA: tellurite resistance/C4-dicarboxylate transporter family protein [Solirubrobacteraceae bacterium]|nr:tellurite resistance/C4-dicarboxylate transporter family protein [Solirubrobacteraceae bacterium]